MGARGFSLIEVVVALAVLLVGLLGTVQLVAISVESLSVARIQGLTVALASSRLEQLRGLTYVFDETGLAVTDTSTSLSGPAPTAGGSGLATGGSLHANIHGFVDHLDRQGRWVSNSTTPPGGAVYTRRWAITATAAAPHVLILQVGVSPVNAPITGGSGAGVPGYTALTTAIARTQR